MNKLFATAAVFAALCVPAIAADDDRDKAVAAIYWYKQYCSAVPASATKWAEDWTQKRSNQVNVERVKVRAEMDALGITAWCTIVTPLLQAGFVKLQYTGNEWAEDDQRTDKACLNAYPPPKDKWDATSGISPAEFARQVQAPLRCAMFHRKLNQEVEFERRRKLESR
jgi:hypothetical protein